MMEETKTMQKKHMLLDHPVLTCVLLLLAKFVLVNLIEFFRLYIISWTPEDPVVAEFTDLLTGVVPTLALAFLVKRRLGEDFQLGFNGRHLGQSFILLLVLLLPQLLMAGTAVFIYDGSITLALIVTALLHGFGPGINEELLVRSLTMGNMERCWRGRKDMIFRTVIGSALLFALYHLINLVYGATRGLDMANVIPQVCNQVVYNFGIGILYGAVYMRTRNIWGPIIVHSLFDAASSVITATWDGGSTNALDSIISTGFSWMSLVATLVYLVVFGGIGLFLIRSAKHQEILSRWPAPETDR